MRLITKSSHNGPGDPDAYWRRRFFILGGGLAVLMVLAWLFGGGGPSKQSTRQAAAHAAAAAREESKPLPAAALGSPSPLPSPSPSLSAAPAQGAPGLPSGAASGSPSPGTPGRTCAPGNIVLSLFTSKPEYSAKESPEFTVYAVSTSPAPCELPYGAGAVRVVVTEHGRMVWDSASCRSGSKPGKVSFTQGVPQEISLSWDRRSRSCGASAKAKPGMLEVNASTDGRWSPVRSFRLK